MVLDRAESIFLQLQQLTHGKHISAWCHTIYRFVPSQDYRVCNRADNVRHTVVNLIHLHLHLQCPKQHKLPSCQENWCLVTCTSRLQEGTQQPTFCCPLPFSQRGKYCFPAATHFNPRLIFKSHALQMHVAEILVTLCRNSRSSTASTSTCGW